MDLIFISFLAGVLTILTPCVLPLLPVIIGTSIDGKTAKKAVIVTGSLAVSVIIFTLVLKATTALIGVPPSVWKTISGGILVIFGIFTLFPKIWDTINIKLGLGGSSDSFLHKSAQKHGVAGDIMVGMALGPVFSSCSPTYAIIISVVLPASFAVGIVNLIFYALGLSIMLLILSLGGQKISSKLRWAVNPQGTFKKVLGIILIVIGLAVIFGYDKKLETALLDNTFYDGLINFESELIEGSIE